MLMGKKCVICDNNNKREGEKSLIGAKLRDAIEMKLV